VTVSISCYDNAGTAGARIYNGIYADRSAVPRVTVAASVPYTGMLSSLSSLRTGASLNAKDQATVFGI
jgi:hypothetical protein